MLIIYLDTGTDQDCGRSFYDHHGDQSAGNFSMAATVYLENARIFDQKDS